jgi:hypothetical protein
MTEIELRKHYEVITDSWKLFKDHSTPTGTDEFWQGLIDKTNDLHMKHGQTIFSEQILDAVVTEIEFIYKRSYKAPAAYPEQQIQTSVFQTQ